MNLTPEDQAIAIQRMHPRNVEWAYQDADRNDADIMTRATKLSQSDWEECGCCGCEHPDWFHGDCRDDRFRR